ncbi:MAG: hypothetical protein ACRENM_07545, partial [Candidatus Dormibacteraceae bacterium]
PTAFLAASAGSSAGTQGGGSQVADQLRRQTISYTCAKGHNFKLRQTAGRGGYCPKCKEHVDGPMTQEQIKARNEVLEAQLRSKHKDNRLRKPKPAPPAEEGPKLEEGKATKIGPGPDPEEPPAGGSDEPKTLSEKHAGFFF